jgi:hypothetical protein
MTLRCAGCILMQPQVNIILRSRNRRESLPESSLEIATIALLADRKK